MWVIFFCWFFFYEIYFKIMYNVLNGCLIFVCFDVLVDDVF